MRNGVIVVRMPEAGRTQPQIGARAFGQIGVPDFPMREGADFRDRELQYLGHRGRLVGRDRDLGDEFELLPLVIEVAKAFFRDGFRLMPRCALTRQAAGEACYLGRSAIAFRLHPPRPYRRRGC